MSNYKGSHENHNIYDDFYLWIGDREDTKVILRGLHKY